MGEKFFRVRSHTRKNGVYVRAYLKPRKSVWDLIVKDGEKKK